MLGVPRVGRRRARALLLALALCLLGRHAAGQAAAPAEATTITGAGAGVRPPKASSAEDECLRRIASLERRLARERGLMAGLRAGVPTALFDEGDMEFADEVGDGEDDGEGHEEAGDATGVDEHGGHHGDGGEGHGEGHGEEEGEGQWYSQDEEEEEEVFSETDIAMSKVLLGSFALVMLILYFVNWADDDIKLYSWMMVSNTICIFVAVLIFSSIHEFTAESIGTEDLHSSGWYILIVYAMLVAWYVMLNVIVALIANEVWPFPHEGSLIQEVWMVADPLRADYGNPVPQGKVPVENFSSKESKSVVTFDDGAEVFVERALWARHRVERWLTCWATLLAHMTGFAAINAGGSLQHMHAFSGSPLLAVLAVVLNTIFLFLLFRLFEWLRELAIHADGVETQGEQLFKEHVEEAETDIAGLSISFLLVQALRFTLYGSLPNKEGIEHEGHGQPLCLLLLGVGFAVVTYMMMFVSGSHDGHGEAHPVWRVKVASVSQSVLGMMFAWCTLFATRGVMLASPLLQSMGAGPQTMQGRILAAMIVSAGTMCLILLIDFIDDNSEAFARRLNLDSALSGRAQKRAVQSFVLAISILVGFSWEHCVDFGLASLSSLTEHPTGMKLVFTSVVFFILIPAWRKHILAKVLVLKRQADARKGSDEPQARGNGGQGGAYSLICPHQSV